MVCGDVLERLSPFLDEELDPWASREVSRHLESCVECSSALARRRQLSETLRRDLEYHRAPELLRARILRAAGAAVPRERRRTVRAPLQAWRWMGAAAGVLVVAGGAWLFASLPLLAARDALTRDAVSNHVRSLMASHLTDVASTDQHTVKPWFAGRLDFSPPVTDFATDGYALVGGRIDYLDGRTVAALVYRRRQHVINVFVWPDSRDAAPRTATRQGFHTVLAKHGGMAYCLVSDLNPQELGAFARMLTGTVGP